jgi:hypothetical protein
MCSSIMSIRFPSSHAHTNLCKKATNICLTRLLQPCGLRQITVIAVGTWPRFSSFGRTEHGTSQCMVLPKRTSATRRNNGLDVRCVAYSIGRTIFERLIRDFSSKGKFTLFCLDRDGCHLIDSSIHLIHSNSASSPSLIFPDFLSHRQRLAGHCHVPPRAQ